MNSDKKTPATRVIAQVEVLPTPSRVDLKTLDDVRLEMARVYRDARSGKIDTADGSKLIYMLSCIGKTIEAERQANPPLEEKTYVPTLADFYAMQDDNGDRSDPNKGPEETEQ